MFVMGDPAPAHVIGGGACEVEVAEDVQGIMPFHLARRAYNFPDHYILFNIHS